MEINDFVLPPEINDDELDELVKSIRSGTQVDSCIISLRDRLKGLIKWIKANKNNSSVISDDEAFGICLMPIYEAAINFDFSFGIKFTTYVFYYIQSALYSEIDERNGVIAPERIKRLVPKVLQIINEYMQENDGEEPSNDKIKSVLLNNGVDVSIDDVESCRNMYFFNGSMQLKDEEDDEFSVFDTVNSSTTDGYIDKTIEEILDIAEVSEREKRIFLLKEEHGMKIKEIADIEKVSASVITRIINRVKAKIWRKKKELGWD